MKTLILSLSLLMCLLYSFGCDSNTSSSNEPEVQEYNFLGEAYWKLYFYSYNWNSLIEEISITSSDTIKVKKTVPDSVALFGIDGIDLNDTLGEFDSIKVEYSSNFDMKMVCATTDTIHGWEGTTVIPKCTNEKYSSFIVYKDQFIKTWGHDSVGMSVCDIIAFTNERTSIIEPGDTVDVKIKGITVYSIR